MKVFELIDILNDVTNDGDTEVKIINSYGLKYSISDFKYIKSSDSEELYLIEDEYNG
jgi:hypothetical protein